MEQHRVMSATLVNGKTEHVPVNAVIGGVWAVHPSVRDGVPIGPGWTVSHFETGILVWRVRDAVAAMEVAQMLERTAILPTDREAFLHWRATAFGAARTAVVEALSRTAPRYDPFLWEIPRGAGMAS